MMTIRPGDVAALFVCGKLRNFFLRSRLGMRPRRALALRDGGNAVRIRVFGDQPSRRDTRFAIRHLVLVAL
jgi:hypothetical protein